MKFNLHVPIKGRVWACLDLIKSVDLKDKTIVDIGSSFGWVEDILKDSGSEKIIGVEPEKEALDFAQKNIKNAEFILGDALNIPLEKKSADIVLLFDVLEHVPKGTEDKVLKEIKRVLKSNGLLLLSTPHDNFFIKFLDPAWYFGHRHYSVKKVNKLLKDTGFNLIDLRLRGNIFSSLYLIWLYLSKFFSNNQLPRNIFFEKLDDLGYKQGNIGTIFLKAEVNK